MPVCTLAAHRGHEIGEISRRVGAVAHLVEAGPGRGFAREQRRDHPTLRAVLVLDELAGLGAELGPRRRAHDRRGDPGRARPRRRRRLPALRRHHRGAQGDPAAARRVLVQRRRLRPLVGLDARHPRRAPDPDHPQRGHRLRRARPAQRRRVPGARHRRPRRVAAAHGPGAGHPRAARPRPLRRGGPPRVRGRGGGVDAGGAVRGEGAARAVRRPRTPRPVVGAAVRHGRGPVPHHPSRGRPPRPRHHRRHPALAARRDPRARTRHRGRGARRRGGRAVLPRAVHAARLLRRAGAQRARLHLRRLLPHRRPRRDHAGRRRALRRDRGPHQGPDQPRRREDQRRGGGAAAAPPPARGRRGRRRHARSAAGRAHLRVRRRRR